MEKEKRKRGEAENSNVFLGYVFVVPFVLIFLPPMLLELLPLKDHYWFHQTVNDLKNTYYPFLTFAFPVFPLAYGILMRVRPAVGIRGVFATLVLIFWMLFMSFITIMIWAMPFDSRLYHVTSFSTDEHNYHVSTRHVTHLIRPTVYPLTVYQCNRNDRDCTSIYVRDVGSNNDLPDVRFILEDGLVCLCAKGLSGSPPYFIPEPFEDIQNTVEDHPECN